MNKSILKSILGGIVFGAFVFFTGPLLLIILVLKFIFTPFGMWRFGWMRHGGGMGYRYGALAMAEKVRNMSTEEYEAFKNKFQHKC